MVKDIRIKLLLLSLTLVFGCSASDDNNATIDEQEPENVMLLKKWNYVDEDFAYLNQFYEYDENDLLISYRSGTFIAEYSYDSDGKLVEKNAINPNSTQTFTYTYDGQNRLIRETEVGLNNYTELSYNANSIQVDKHYENGSGTYDESSRLTLDASNRIIKMELITEPTSYTARVQEYVYDGRNNMTQLTFKEFPSNDPDLVVNYEYDDKKNHSYYAYRNLYRSIYFLECRTGIPNYQSRGMTPNNFTVYGSTTYAYDYNELDFPVYVLKTYNNGSGVDTAEYTFEYY